jgi:hypothetical protein
MIRAQISRVDGGLTHASTYFSKDNPMTVFLRIKHWQLFTIVVVIPVALSAFERFAVPRPGATMEVSVVSSLAVMIFYGGLFGWRYSLGASLYRKRAPGVRLNVVLFNVCMLVPTVVVSAMWVFFMIILPGRAGHEPIAPGVLGLIAVIHLFSIFCIFYCISFVAKALKSVELQREATMTSSAGEFILVWLFPIGVWIIQPRVNRLFDSRS